MHILLGLYFARDNQFEKAAIEARYAGNLLSGEWSAEGQFDDPALRVLLAALWMSCGNWDDARVDLRRASLLSPKYEDIAILSELNNSPQGMTIILGGPGAEPILNANMNINFIRGLRNLGFSYSGRKSYLTWKEKNSRSGQLSPELTTEAWHQRHLTRDNAIHELVEDSKYFRKMSASALKEGTRGGAKITAAVILGSLMVAAGGGLAYAGVAGHSVEVAAAGIILIAVGIQKAADLTTKAIKETSIDYNEDMDISKEYRFVRFLPEYLWVTDSHTKQFQRQGWENRSESIRLVKPFGKIPVKIGYFSDSIKE